MPAPTRVSSHQQATSPYTSTGTSKTCTGVTFQVGDYLEIKASAEQHGTSANVTPTLSAGAATWTKYGDVGAAGTNNSGAWSWVGVVTTAASNATVTLARPTGSNVQWGFSVTVIRGASGIGVRFEGTNGTGSTAPGVTQTCSANSLLTCQSNDWNAVDGASRTWRTVNGAPISESSYYRSASTHTIYGGYVTDSGPAGSVTMGLTAPANQRWVMVGFEFLGSSGGANQALAGTVAGTSALSGSMRARVALAGAVAATTALTGAVTANHPLGGTVAATTTAAGAPTADHPLGGSVAATTTVSGSPGAQQSLAGTIAATTAATGTITLRTPLAGSVAATTAAVGTPTSRQGLAGTVNAVSSTAGTFFESGPQVYPLAGNVTATTTTAGSITARHPLGGTVAAASTAVGAIARAASLAGTVDGTTVLVGNIAATVTLAGQVQATSGTADLFVSDESVVVEVGTMRPARFTAAPALTTPSVTADAPRFLSGTPLPPRYTRRT